MSWKVESKFKHNGLTCVVIMTEMGHRCGYVGVPNTHKLHGVDYTDKMDFLKTVEADDITTDNAGLGQFLGAMCGEYKNESLSPVLYFNVHGGITFSGVGKEYPIKSDLWWFGFDCAHYNDASDPHKALEYGLITKETCEGLTSYACLSGVVRSLEYCKTECRGLADQLGKSVFWEGQE